MSWSVPVARMPCRNVGSAVRGESAGANWENGRQQVLALLGMEARKAKAKATATANAKATADPCGMTTRKARAKAKARARARARAKADSDSLRE
jgi:hypothetical protein